MSEHWPDFDYSKLPDIWELREGRRVVQVDRQRGEFWTVHEGGDVDSPRIKHVLPRAKPRG